jgi:predicted metal-binding membrane protein
VTYNTDATALEAILRRDRTLIGVAISIIVVVCWAYIASIAEHMRTPVAGIDDMITPEAAEWSLGDAASVLVMWSVMMVGMMLPTAARPILLYAYLGRRAAADEPPFTPAIWLALGYALSWIAFSLIATAVQWALESASLLTPTMASKSAALCGALLLLAGLYQVSPLKSACLARCQAPLGFIERQGGFRHDAQGSIALGWRHGLALIGCCWALMALLFISGVMNIVWMAVIGFFLLIEKLLASGPLLSRMSGVALILAGAAVLLQALWIAG